MDFTYNGNTYQGTVYTNSYYPTFSSMYTVYLGLQDRTVIFNANISPAVGMSVSRIIKVN